MARNLRSRRRGGRPAACLVADPGSKAALRLAAEAAPLAVSALPQDGASACEPAAAQPDIQRTLQGRIERIGRTGIEGWVWDPHAPAERIRLELAEGNRRLAEIVADDDRPELSSLHAATVCTASTR